MQDVANETNGRASSGKNPAFIDDRTRVVLLFLLFLTFVVQIVGIFRRHAYGDEFQFLTNVHRAVNGEGLNILQTFYVHLFRWLPFISNNELDQIVAARLLYLVPWAISLFLLYRLARQVLDLTGAASGVVLFALFSYSLENATTFRIDGLLLPVLLGAALLLIKPTLSRVAAAGALSGLALALSIKAVLWAPALLGVFLVTSLADRRLVTLGLATGAAAGIAALIGTLFLHETLLVERQFTASGTGGSLAVAGSWMFGGAGLFPRSAALRGAILGNVATFALVAYGLGLTIADLHTAARRKDARILLWLSSPALAIAFYANSFAYAYLVLVPGACLLAGRAISALWQIKRGVVLAFLLIAAVSVPTTLWRYRIDAQAPQRQLSSIVHGLFEEPVFYIDHTGFVSSFPRPLLYMTEYGMIGYNGRGRPVLTDYIRQRHPPFLIATTTVLDVWENGDAERIPEKFRLLPEDVAAIRATYAHFWGPLYLAGREWRDLRAGDRFRFEIVIPGDYTLVGDASLTIDSQQYSPGATVTLAAGPHEIETGEPIAHARLLWGRGTAIPTAEYSELIF